MRLNFSFSLAASYRSTHSSMFVELPPVREVEHNPLSDSSSQGFVFGQILYFTKKIVINICSCKYVGRTSTFLQRSGRICFLFYLMKSDIISCATTILDDVTLPVDIRSSNHIMEISEIGVTWRMIQAALFDEWFKLYFVWKKSMSIEL